MGSMKNKNSKDSTFILRAKAQTNEMPGEMRGKNCGGLCGVGMSTQAESGGSKQMCPMSSYVSRKSVPASNQVFLFSPPNRQTRHLVSRKTVS